MRYLAKQLLVLVCIYPPQVFAENLDCRAGSSNDERSMYRPRDNRSNNNSAARQYYQRSKQSEYRPLNNQVVSTEDECVSDPAYRVPARLRMRDYNYRPLKENSGRTSRTYPSPGHAREPSWYQGDADGVYRQEIVQDNDMDTGYRPQDIQLPGGDQFAPELPGGDGARFIPGYGVMPYSFERYD